MQARRVRSGQLGEDGNLGKKKDPSGHGRHDGPSWSRAVSASLLLACTAMVMGPIKQGGSSGGGRSDDLWTMSLGWVGASKPACSAAGEKYQGPGEAGIWGTTRIKRDL